MIEGLEEVTSTPPSLSRVAIYPYYFDTISARRDSGLQVTVFRLECRVSGPCRTALEAGDSSFCA